ncbi:MAG: acyl-CoA dehydrogenase family protein [Gammaproteobacteria bacterium]|nr:acyl-CoA dehydrogenase family protein [Gammaproteobacteria bacterium]
MNVTFSAEEVAFRKEVRDYFENEFPQDILRMQNEGVPLQPEDLIRWHKAVNEKGWLAENWPVEYGGTGWSPVQKYIFAEERARANAPPVLAFGVNMVGPIIYTYGNEEQKRRFLPDILQTNVWWCQGYSEPGAGSDLASLKTRADLRGDHYVINGTKTWTTLGQFADWIFCLVRTNSDVARRQEGISFILVDMKTPGVSIKPIVLLDGEHEVNEIHFDNVEVPVENLVGEEGKGWTYGKVLLQHERTNIAGVARSKFRLSRLRSRAQKSVRGAAPLAEDRNFMRGISAAEVELKALEYTELRKLASVAAGKAPGPESSILKVAGTELLQAIDCLEMEAAGYYGLAYVRDQFVLDLPDEERVGDTNQATAALNYFNNRKQSIFGGSNEIQKNIIAKHVLGL